MRARKLWILAGVLVLMGALVTSVPSSAKSTKTPLDLWQVACLVDPGIEWVSDDGVLHGRGRVEELVLYAYDPDAMAAEIVGSGVAVGNANIKLATGDGNFFGAVSVIYLPVSASATFDGRYQGRMTGWLLVSGKGVSHGTGEAHGMKVVLHFGIDVLPAWLEAVLPMSCPPDKPLVAILHNIGFLHDRHGG